MTRYTAMDSGDGYQSARQFSLSASRQTSRAHPVGPHIIGLQTEAENPMEKGRKRIAVACSRCRKRKIKCSGDPKNGQGCQNCRNAGSDPSQCQFLRVSSSSIECVEWPYVMSNGPQYIGNPTIGVYGIGSQGVTPSIPTTVVPSRRMQQSWPYVYPSIPSATEYYNYDVTASEAPYEPQYSFHQTSSALTAADHRSAQQSFSHQELLRQWPNLPKVERMHLNTYNSTPSTTSYDSSGMTYPVSLAPMTAVDPAYFPSMGALAKSLPRSQQHGMRAVPVPKTESSHAESDGQLVAPAPGYAMVPRSTASPPASWYQERAVLESYVPSSEMETINTQGQVSYPGCSKTRPSSARETAMAYNRMAAIANSTVPSQSEVVPSAFNLPSSNVDEPHLYRSHSQEAHQPLRARVPSTGSLSYSTASASPKRGSVSSSGTDTTLLNGVAPQGGAAPHLRPLQPAQTPCKTKTTTTRRVQRDRKTVR